MAKKRNYIRLTEEELKTAVHESVLRILLEKSGISDEVVEATNQVVDELFKIDFKGLNWQWFVINDDSLIWPYKSIKTNVNLPNTISLPMFKDIRGFNKFHKKSPSFMWGMNCEKNYIICLSFFKVSYVYK